MMRASVVVVIFIVATCFVVASCEPIHTQATQSELVGDAPLGSGSGSGSGSAGKSCMTEADCANTTLGSADVYEIADHCSVDRTCDRVLVAHPSCDCVNGRCGAVSAIRDGICGYLDAGLPYSCNNVTTEIILCH